MVIVGLREPGVTEIRPEQRELGNIKGEPSESNKDEYTGKPISAKDNESCDN